MVGTAIHDERPWARRLLEGATQFMLRGPYVAATVRCDRVMASTYAGSMTSSSQSVLVVGGGIIGLTSAVQLGLHGFRVTMFDPQPGKGATWAAAGMIAPSAEIAPGEKRNYRLQCGALGAWRDLNTALRDLIDAEVDLYETGTLLVGWDASDRRLVERFVEVATDFGVEVPAVDRRSEPSPFEGLSGRIVEGRFIAGDGWLDPDQAVTRLRAALGRLDVTVIEQSVHRIGVEGDEVVAFTGDGSFRGSFGLLATGATSLPEGAATSGANLVRPVRGMTARVHGLDRSTQPTVRAFVHGRTFYMVSRPGGYCVLGATSEERSEPAIEVGEFQRLLRDALDVVPALETANLLETRMGLRPASEDLEPFFEVLGGGRWAWSSGHYRHGVTLAPIAALRMAEFASTAI